MVHQGPSTGEADQKKSSADACRGVCERVVGVHNPVTDAYAYGGCILKVYQRGRRGLEKRLLCRSNLV
jgi:hypothetical protein